MSRHPAQQWRRLIRLLVVVQCIAVAGIPLMARAADAHTQASPVTAHALARFARINAQARQIQRRYRRAFAHASSPQQAQRVAQAMNQAVTRMFHKEGMSVSRYRNIRQYLMREALNGSRPLVVAGTMGPNGGS